MKMSFFFHPIDLIQTEKGEALMIKDSLGKECILITFEGDAARISLTNRLKVESLIKRKVNGDVSDEFLMYAYNITRTQIVFCTMELLTQFVHNPRKRFVTTKINRKYRDEIKKRIW